MQEIIVKSQQELDEVPIDFDGRIIIKYGTKYNRAVVNRRFKFSVEAWGNSSVEARGNSSVKAWGNSSVEAWGNSSVEAWGNSSVKARENSSVEARENSSVEAWGNSSVEAWGNSSVEARENSSVEARENSSVEARENSSVEAKHNSQVTNRANKAVRVSGNARVVYDPKTIQEYIDLYELENDGEHVRLFKAVHKRDGKYQADWCYFEYKIGEVAEASGLDTDVTEDCGQGIHMAYKEWCVAYGANWPDLAILELEADISGVIVPLYGAGKVRAARAKVIREVQLEECGMYGKILAKKAVKA